LGVGEGVVKGGLAVLRAGSAGSWTAPRGTDGLESFFFLLGFNVVGYDKVVALVAVGVERTVRTVGAGLFVVGDEGR
jgi:hypothetical protein